MYIGEPIEVSAIFKGRRLQPAYFLWRRKLYKIRRINGRYSDRKGQWRRYHYAVQADTDEVYELSLDTEHMEWHLVKIHSI